MFLRNKLDRFVFGCPTLMFTMIKKMENTKLTFIKGPYYRQLGKCLWAVKRGDITLNLLISRNLQTSSNVSERDKLDRFVFGCQTQKGIPFSENSSPMFCYLSAQFRPKHLHGKLRVPTSSVFHLVIIPCFPSSNHQLL